MDSPETLFLQIKAAAELVNLIAVFCNFKNT